MDFTNKVVVFVGGLGAIGFETSKQIIKKDIAYLIILDAIENADAVRTLQSSNPKCKVRYIKFDITNKAAIQSAVSEIVKETKYIDILINGAGILQESNVERTINVNLVGLINTTFEVLPYMDKSKHGRGGLIANIASIAGLEPLSPVVIYSTTKFGVVGFTRCMADPHYFDVTGVAVTAICPGFTESPLKNSINRNYTFDYSKPLADELSSMRTQTPVVCGEHFLKVIEANDNGSLWISDCGNLTKVDFKVHWNPTPN